MKKTFIIILCSLLALALFSCAQDTPAPPVPETDPEPQPVPVPKVYHTVTLNVSEGDTRKFEVEKGTEWSFPEIDETEDGHYPVVALEEDGHIIPIELPVKIEKDRTFTLKWTDWKYSVEGLSRSLILKDTDVSGTDTEIWIPYMVDGKTVTTLGGAFRNSAVTTVHIPDWVKIIDGAFSGCSKLMEIRIPATIDNIVQNSFSRVSPEAVIIIEDSSRMLDWEYSWQNGYDGNIKAEGEGIHMHDGVAYLETATESGEKALEVLVLCDRQGTEKTLEIPDKVDGLPVIALSDHSFANVKNLSRIVLPEGIEEIGDHAFAYSSLSDIPLPSTLRKIGSYAFSGCEQLKTLTIPAATREVEEDPWGSESFDSVTFDKYWTQESWYDKWTDDLSVTPTYNDVKVTGDHTWSTYTDPDGNETVMLISVNAVPNADGHIEKLDLPSEIDGKKVTRLANRIFENKKIDSLTWPDSLMVLGAHSLEQSVIKGLTLPDTLRVIEKRALSYIGTYKGDPLAITVPSSVEYAGEDAFYASKGKVQFAAGIDTSKWHTDAFYDSYCEFVYLDGIVRDGIHYATFSAPDGGKAWKVTGADEGITEVTIPDKIDGVPVVEIQDSAFKKHPSITKVVLPSSLKRIGSNAFQECPELISVDTGGAEEICLYSFNRCPKLKEAVLHEGLRKIGLCSFDTSGITSVTIPDSVTEIEYGAFSDSALTSVTIGSGVRELPKHAFSHCEELTSITVPSTVEIINEKCFYNTPKLHTLILSEGLRTLRIMALQNCGAKEIIIPESVEYISEYMFEYCPNLEKVKLPTMMTNIPTGTFKDCKGLETVIWPEAQVMIYGNAFESAVFKENAVLTVPANVKSVGYDVFRNCKLSKIVFEGKPAFSNDPFGGWPETQSIIMKDREAAGALRQMMGSGNPAKVYFQDASGTEVLIEYKAPEQTT